MWRETPLVFDDELPSDVQVFKLSVGVTESEAVHLRTSQPNREL